MQVTLVSFHIIIASIFATSNDFLVRYDIK